MKRIFLHLFIFIFTGIAALAQWNINPAVNTPVCLQPNNQLEPRPVPDGKGGVIITWLDFRADATQSQGDIYVQRLDAAGNPKWMLNGPSVCNLATDQAAPSSIEDGFGGIIIAWNDWRNGNRDIYAQRFDSLGTPLWASNGVPVVQKTNQQQDARLVADGAGGAIVVWQDSINGAWDIYAQRINSAGAMVWASTGVVICSATQPQINPRIKPDGSGGAIMTWQDKRNTVDYDIYAQRINNLGAVQWTTNGVAICSMAGTQSNPKIEIDGTGGVYIGWQDKRNGNDFDIYVQHLSASGVVSWTSNGAPVCVTSGNQSAIDLTSDGLPGVALSWKDDRNGNFDIYAQMIGVSGNPIITANGVAVATGNANQLNPNMHGDGLGHIIITWQDSSSNGWEIRAQRVNIVNGSLFWSPAGSPVGIAAGNQGDPKNISDGNGGSIFVFQDARNGTDYDIYAHHLYWNGTEDGIQEMQTSLAVSVFPNPMSDIALLKVMDAPGEKLSITLSDLTGRNILTIPLHDGQATIGRGNLVNGTYFYRLFDSSGNARANGKLILVNP